MMKRLLAWLLILHCAFAQAGPFAITGGAAPNVSNATGILPIANGGTASAYGPVMRSYLAGCGLSTAGGSATMSIAVCSAADSTNVAMLALAAFTKTTSAWSLGTGGGAMDTSTVANATWYHWFLIQRVDTGVVDVLFSLSPTTPTMPANYTLKRRIGSGLTNGSAQWVSFVQDGDYFTWLVAVRDVNTTAPGTNAVTATLTVPSGVNVTALFNATAIATSNLAFFLFSDLAFTDAAPSLTAIPGANLAMTVLAQSTAGIFAIRTNTSAQIRYRGGNTGADTVVAVMTYGWLDRRGRDN